MPTCDQCGNDYDKAFQITEAGRTMTFDSSSAPFKPWRRSVPIAACGSWGTGWRKAALSAARSRQARGCNSSARPGLTRPERPGALSGPRPLPRGDVPDGGVALAALRRDRERFAPLRTARPSSGTSGSAGRASAAPF